MSQKRFENFPKALPSKQRASIFTVVKGEVVTQRAKPLTIVKILAMTAGRERPKEYLMNLKLRQICVHLIGGDTAIACFLAIFTAIYRFQKDRARIPNSKEYSKMSWGLILATSLISDMLAYVWYFWTIHHGVWPSNIDGSLILIFGGMWIVFSLLCCWMLVPRMLYCAIKIIFHA